jgi:hypothetical protein
MPPSESSRVNDPEVEELHHLKSTLISADVLTKYSDFVTKLKSVLAALDLEDHAWHLESYDFNGVGVVQLLCGKCNKKFGGVRGDHSKDWILGWSKPVNLLWAPLGSLYSEELNELRLTMEHLHTVEFCVNPRVSKLTVAILMPNVFLAPPNKSD